MAEPNFLCIGAQKAATFWLWQMLQQHPAIYVSPKKEVHFFNKQENYDKGFDWYRSHFAGCTTETAIGEFTPNYFWVTHDEKEIAESHRTRDIPRLVYEQYPKMKLIVSLRDPVHRAVSAYYHLVNRGYFSPFDRFSEVSHSRGVISMGFYHSHLSEWLKYFAADQIKVLIYEEDILKNKEQTVDSLFRFLEVDPEFKPNAIERRYKSRAKGFSIFVSQHSKLLGKVVSKTPMLRDLDLPAVKVSEEEIETLVGIYAEENRKLEALLGRDLSAWKHA